jgi:DNA-binding response OmpR family regulator
MKTKILYVEDEPFLGQIVSDGLITSGYIVNRAFDGEEGYKTFVDTKPDICVLDIMLPVQDGYTLAELIRKEDQQVPIIFLSSKVLPDDVVKGFKSGGNDYLRKPFHMDELLIRIESLISRFGTTGDIQHEENIYKFGNCILDTLTQKLQTSSGNYSLSYRECSLMTMLIEHKNTVLKRQYALEEIWGDDSFYNTRSMDVFMTNLRKYLKGETAIQIISVRGIGYKMICN